MTFDELTLDHLNSILNKAEIEDHEIIGGIELTHPGYQRLALRMGVDLETLQLMINSLMEKLRKEAHMYETYSQLLDEEDENFSYEKDWLGNVTVRNNETGDEVFLRGSEAAEMLKTLQSGIADEQEILAQYMESHPITESDDLEDDSYEDELEITRGTYNFPWKTKTAHGTGTASYSGNDNIKLVSIRDEEGDEIEATPELEAELKMQAVAFIGNA